MSTNTGMGAAGGGGLEFEKDDVISQTHDNDAHNMTGMCT